VTAEPDIDLVVRIVLRVLRELEGRVSTAPAARAIAVVTERDVLEAVPSGRLAMRRGAVVTPLARDTAHEKGVVLVEVA
jgi:hypothetical protein